MQKKYFKLNRNGKKYNFSKLQTIRFKLFNKTNSYPKSKGKIK